MSEELTLTESSIPVLPLRDVVVFPHMVIPLFVGRKKSIKALERSMEIGKHILLVAQKEAADDDPGPDDIYEVGTVASILQLLKLPDGTVKVLVEARNATGSRPTTPPRSSSAPRSSPSKTKRWTSGKPRF